MNPVKDRLQISPPPPSSPSPVPVEIAIEKTAEPELQKGEIVRLPKHGEAKVKEVDGKNVTVQLETGESKIFKKDFIETD